MKSSRNILLIGEEEFFHWCLAHQLESAGYKVSHAKDLESGRDLLKQSAAELVIYDNDFSSYHLPRFGQWMAGNPKTRGLLLTSATPPSRTQLQWASANACISKPFDIQDLIWQVEEIFGSESGSE